MCDPTIPVSLSRMEIVSLVFTVIVASTYMGITCTSFAVCDGIRLRIIWALTTILLTSITLYVLAFAVAVFDSAVLTVTIYYDRLTSRRGTDVLVDHFSASTYILGRITHLATTPRTVVAALARRSHFVLIPLIIMILMPVNCAGFGRFLPAEDVSSLYGPARVFKCVIGMNVSASTSRDGIVLQNCAPTFRMLPPMVNVIDVNSLTETNGVRIAAAVVYSDTSLSVELFIIAYHKGARSLSAGVLGLENSLMPKFYHDPMFLDCDIYAKGFLGGFHPFSNISLVFVVARRSVFLCDGTLSRHEIIPGHFLHPDYIVYDDGGKRFYVLSVGVHVHPHQTTVPVLIDSAPPLSVCCNYYFGRLKIGDGYVDGNVCLKCVHVPPPPYNYSEVIIHVPIHQLAITGFPYVHFSLDNSLYRRYEVAIKTRRVFVLVRPRFNHPLAIYRSPFALMPVERSPVVPMVNCSRYALVADNMTVLNIDVLSVLTYEGVVDDEVYSMLYGSEPFTFEFDGVAVISSNNSGVPRCSDLQVFQCVVEQIDVGDYSDADSVDDVAVMITCLVVFTGLMGLPGMFSVKLIVVGLLLICAQPVHSAVPRRSKVNVVVMRRPVVVVPPRVSAPVLPPRVSCPPRFVDVIFDGTSDFTPIAYVQCGLTTVVGDPVTQTYCELVCAAGFDVSVRSLSRVMRDQVCDALLVDALPSLPEDVVQQNYTVGYDSVSSDGGPEPFVEDDVSGEDELPIDIGVVVSSWMNAVWRNATAGMSSFVSNWFGDRLPRCDVTGWFRTAYDFIKYYVFPGYSWEVFSTNLDNAVHCLAGSSNCVFGFVRVPFDLYMFNVCYMVVTYISSVFVASLYIAVKSRTNKALVFGREVRRYVYNGGLFAFIVLFCLSVNVRLADCVMMSTLAFLSGLWFGVSADENNDSCLRAPIALPAGMFWLVKHWVFISLLVMKLLFNRFRILVVVVACGLVVLMGKIRSEWFVVHAKVLSRGSSVPILWVVLSIVSSVCSQLCVIALAAPHNPAFTVLVGCYALVASAFSLVLFFLFTVVCVSVGSTTLWDVQFSGSIPRLLQLSGRTTRLIRFSTFAPEAVSRLVMLVMLIHLCHIVFTQSGRKIYQVLTYGFTPANTAVIFQRRRNWRVVLARKFIPNPLMKNVYWLTATTGAGKTTVESYSRYVIDDDIIAGIGFNVVDVDACVMSVSGSVRQGISEARLAATQGPIGNFLTSWMPIAKRYVESQLEIIQNDSQRASLPTLVMVHVPAEGLSMGLPICNFLGHIHVSEDEMNSVADARSRANPPVAKDVTKAFVISDNVANDGITKIDWTDVQEYLAPVVGVKNVPLAIFPDVDPERVYVKVEVRPVTSVVDAQVQVHSSVGPIPLVALVRRASLYDRLRLTYVRSDEFGDTKKTILEAAKARKYYDSLPLSPDGVVDYKKLDGPLNCVVYRLDLPARHGMRGVSSAIRMRMDIMGAPDRDKAALLLNRRYGTQLGDSPPMSVDQQALLSGLSGGFGISGSSGFGVVDDPSSSSDLAAVQQQLQHRQQRVEAVLEREMKAVGAAGVGVTPPLAQFQAPPVTTKISIHGIEWPDDDSFVRASRNMLPPAIPTRTVSMNPCPINVCKVIECDAALTPATPIEALRRYVPASLAGKVEALVKHGDAPSKAKHPRQLRGWAIRFSDEPAKLQFFQQLRPGVIGTELIATPFMGTYWKAGNEQDSTEAVQKFKREMLQEN